MNIPSTQSDSNLSVPPAVCWVGLDWADQKHWASVRTIRDRPGLRLAVGAKPEDLDAFFLKLRAQHPEGRLAVGLEQGRGPVLYALFKYDFLVIYPVNPAAAAAYRQAFAVSGAKGDIPDSDLLAELISMHADRLRPLEIEEPITRQLQLVNEHRRGFIEERSALTNRLGDALKCVYPVALEMAGDKLSEPMALDFLERWPNLKALKKAKPATLREFYYKHNCRSDELIEARLRGREAAKPLTEDPALLEAYGLQIEQLAAHLRVLAQTIDRYDARVKELFEQHSEAWLFKDLPGAGPALGPRLAAAFGTKRNNWPSAYELVCFNGVAPVQKQSGNQKVIHFRYARPTFLHQTFVEFAKCSLGRCAWAKLLYEEQRRKGKGHWAALRVVAFKWCRILWRCWKDRKPYDELTYLRALKKDGVALYAPLYKMIADA